MDKFSKAALVACCPYVRDTPTSPIMRIVMRSLPGEYAVHTECVEQTDPPETSRLRFAVHWRQLLQVQNRRSRIAKESTEKGFQQLRFAIQVANRIELDSGHCSRLITNHVDFQWS